MGKKSQTKVNVLMCTVAVLLCATLYTTHLVGGLYARYTTSANSSDSARVAAFNIEQDGTIFETVKAEIAPGKTQNATLVIKNDSEVAVEYTLTVTNVTGNLPLEFNLSPVNDNEPAVTLEKHENRVSKFSATQTAGNHTDQYMLNIIWEKNANEETDLAYIGMVDYVTISVTATQID